MKNLKIGFVGLGRMGANMARRLHDLGYKLSAFYDIREHVTRELADELDSQACYSPAEVSAQSDLVITVVTDDEAMQSIYFGQGNLLTNGEGRIFINCATVSPAIHRKISQAARDAKAASLEACMASSIPQARDGQLFLMIGGDQDLFEKCRPLFEDLSKSLYYVGPAGKAAEVKALVNMVMNINTAALAEGLGVGKALGIDLQMLKEIFSQTGANSRVLQTDADDMIQREHDCFFSAEHAAKDTGIALSLAASKSIPAPLAQATHDQYTRMISLGLGQLDKSGVAELTFPGRALISKAGGRNEQNPA